MIDFDNMYCAGAAAPDVVPDILIVGASIIDVLVRPASPSVFETGSYPADDIAMQTGGDALNEALVLAKLGRRVRLDTILGDDDGGRFIAARCQKAGVILPEDVFHSEFKTGVNVVLVREDGSRHFLTGRNGSLRKLRAGHLHPFDSRIGIMCFASIFVFPEFGDTELAGLFAGAKARGITVCADMTKCKHGETLDDMRRSMPLIDYLIPNDEEAMLLTRKSSVEDAAAAFLASGVKNVVIKCGARGCYIAQAGASYYMPPVPGVSCIDTTGAGDSFAAGFLYALSAGCGIGECADFANRCGARAVASIGATSWLDA